MTSPCRDYFTPCDGATMLARSLLRYYGIPTLARHLTAAIL